MEVKSHARAALVCLEEKAAKLGSLLHQGWEPWRVTRSPKPLRGQWRRSLAAARSAKTSTIDL